MSQYCYGCMKPLAEGASCDCGYEAGKQNYSHQLPVGTVLNQRYLIGRVLGQGGFGITYIGLDQLLETTVAIKEFYPHTLVARNVRQSLAVACADDNAQEQFRRSRDRFLKEARTLSKLNEVPGIVHVQNVCLENNTAYIVMEYLEGMDLKQHMLRQNKPLTAEETLRFFQPVLYSLQKVHEQGLIHRDISPDNIMVLKDGNIKLLDFGAAREVNREEQNRSFASELVVKQGFGPIEQYRENADLGPSADVYALCASMYYCMTGQVPNNAPDRFMGSDNVDWKKIPDLTDAQIAGLTKGMAIRAEDRFSSVEQLWHSLYDTQEEAEQPESPGEEQPEENPEEKETKKTGGKKIVFLLAAIAAVICIAWGVLLGGQKDPASTEVISAAVPETTEATAAPETPAEETTQPTEPVREGLPVTLASEGTTLTFDGENLHMQVVDNRDVTVTLSGLNLKESYLTNRSTTKQNHVEYRWGVEFQGVNIYAVWTNSYASAPGEEEEKTIDQMQHSLWECEDEGDRKTYRQVIDVKMTHTRDSITWQFSVPPGHSIDFPLTQGFKTTVYEITDEDWQEQVYYVENAAPLEQPPAEEPAQEGLPVTLTSSDGILTFGGENLKMQVVNQRDVTLTLSGLNVKDSYAKVDDIRYGWRVTIQGDQNYLVCTWPSGKQLNSKGGLSITEMDDQLLLVNKKGTSSVFVSDVKMTYTKDSITWKFTLPRDQFVDFTGTTGFQTEVYDITKSMPFVRQQYSVEKSPGKSKAEDGSEPVWKKNLLTPDLALAKDTEAFLANRPAPSLSELYVFYSNRPVYGSDIPRKRIAEVFFLDTLAEAPEDAWDVSYNQDRSVLAWTQKNWKYSDFALDLYIAGEGGVNGSMAAASLFHGYAELATIHFNDSFFTEDAEDMSSMFAYCRRLGSVDLTQLDTSSAVDMSRMFYCCESLKELYPQALNTDKVINMEGMFSNCSSLTHLSTQNVNTSNVENMAELFAGCASLTSLDFTGMDTSNVVNMRGMFSGLSAMTSLNIGSLNTAKVTDMSNMFRDCIKIRSISLGRTNTSKVTNMSGMFKNCEKMWSVDISNLNTSQVTDMSEMFYNCYNIGSLDMDSFDTSNVTTMRSMFELCFYIERLDVSHFNTPKVRDFSRMFYGCKYLSIVDVLDYDVSSMETAKDMFSGCGRLNLEFKKLGGEYIWSS